MLDRHARVHESRAGGDVAARRRHAQRHLLARRAAVRAARRAPAVRPQLFREAGLDEVRRTIREQNAPTTQRAVTQLGLAPAYCSTPSVQSRQACQTAPRRPGLDRLEGARKRSHPPLPDGNALGLDIQHHLVTNPFQRALRARSIAWANLPVVTGQGCRSPLHSSCLLAFAVSMGVQVRRV